MWNDDRRKYIYEVETVRPYPARGVSVVDRTKERNNSFYNERIDNDNDDDNNNKKETGQKGGSESIMYEWHLEDCGRRMCVDVVCFIYIHTFLMNKQTSGDYS
jgi:hypothetical protein